MSDWNLMPGSGWLLARMERAADAYDAALCIAWDRLWEWAPDGVGWDVVECEQDADANFIVTFRDAGGLEFTTTVNPWPEDGEP
jgi:hypothetical protein